MLEILVYQEAGRPARLELSPDSSLSMVRTSPFFDDTLEEGEYSLPIEIPFSDHNCRILGAPEMLESPGTATLPYWPIEIRRYGVLELSDVKLTLLGHKGDYSYRKGAYIATVTGRESLFGSLIAGKSLRKLQLGGEVFTGSDDPRLFATRVMKRQAPAYSYLGFAPIYWPDFIDTSRDDYTTEFVTRDMINDVVAKPALADGWIFGTPDGNGNPIYIGSAGYASYRTVPFLQLHYVLRCVFQEHGYSLFGDFLEDPDYAKLFIFNNFAINIYNTQHFDINRYIQPQHHVPDISIVDFLKAIQGAFNLGFVWHDGKKVELRYKQSLLTSNEVVNVTRQTVDSYEAAKSEVATGGVRIGWTWDSADDFVKDRVKDDIEVSRLRAAVPTYAAAGALSLSPAPAVGDLVYVLSENAYYAWDGATWSFRSERQQAQVIGNGESDISPKISTLSQLQNYVADSTLYNDVCAVRQQGSYYTTLNKTLAESAYDLRLFYIGTYTAGSAVGMPVSHTHCYDPATGTKRVTSSLSFTAPDGIYYRHHRAWIETQRAGWAVKASFLPDTTGLSFTTKVLIKHTQYLVRQLKPVLGKSAAIGAELVKV